MCEIKKFLVFSIVFWGSIYFPIPDNIFFGLQDIQAQTNPPDVSGMFNERGYYKSESVKIDEEEIINDFNGNLQYSFPIYQEAGDGDLHLSLSINYNGAVNYQTLNANQNVIASNFLPRYNFSAPGWILSVNDMAVQMLNIETNYLTTQVNTINGPSASNERVHLLATGYHISDNLNCIAGTGSRDMIYLMRKDGSVIYLENLATSTEIGDFYSTQPGEYAKAYVEYLPNDPTNFPGYKNRKISLMLGDGLTYIYEEVKIDYYDVNRNTPATLCFKPQVMLLKRIMDKFGHCIYFQYSDPNEFKGRPILTQISSVRSNIVTTYSILNNFGIQIKINNNNYLIECLGQSGDFGETGNHRFYPTGLKYPTGKETFFQHEYYRRKAKNTYNPVSAINTLSLIFDNTSGLQRLTSFTSSNGGKRFYTYKNPASTSLEVDMTPPAGYHIMSALQYYYGQGRDLFYVNMISEKDSYLNNDKITQSNFDYGYTFVPSENRPNYQIDPIGKEDIYSTTISISNPPGREIYNTPAQKKVKYYYKNYKTTQNQTHSDYPDWNGHTKLDTVIEYLDNENDFYKKTVYKYLADGINYLYAQGTFLDTAVIEEYHKGETAERRTNYRYELFNFPYTSYYTNRNIIKRIIKINPDQTQEQILNNYISDKSIHYKDGLYNPGGNQQYDTCYYYRINLPVSKSIYSKGGQMIYFDSSFYYYTNNASGYMGQLYLKREFDLSEEGGGLNNFRDTKYFYNHNDTLGTFLYLNTLQINEGTLKQVINPQGRVTDYYYRLFAGYSDITIESGPAIKAKKLEQDGTIQETALLLTDNRFPVITRPEVQPGIFVNNYALYNYQGAPTIVFDDSKMITTAEYDKLGRISGIVSPGDFSSESEDITYTKKYNYDDNAGTVEVLSKYNQYDIGKSKVYFDGFYRPAQSRIYLSDTEFDSTAQSYNYLGLKLEDKDGRENKTHYSYDELLNLKEVDNADNSQSLIADSIRTNFETSYGMVYGLIDKKEYIDEENNHSQKYYDVMGNLIRDVRVIFDSQGQPTDYIFTDYKYDELYRVIRVRTPEGKQIYYEYDGYGRQSKRITSDNGTVGAIYNKDDVVRFSQDNSQLKRDNARPSRYFTFRGYDGLNRLVYSGETQDISSVPGFTDLNGTQHYSFENYNEHPDNFLLVNVYDTLSYQVAEIFTPPDDYYWQANNTKGKLLATAYRTLYSDNWNYKYYRYDARGRVIKMWNIINELGQKTFDYTYNSQNQMLQMTYQNGNKPDYRRFYYSYDKAGREKFVSVDGGGPVPDYQFPIVEYGYNENSQIDSIKYHNGSYHIINTFNARSWLTSSLSTEDKFSYALDYFYNGNIKAQRLMGSYRLNYSGEQREVSSTFRYDNSNRLLNVRKTNVKVYSPEETFTYDKDGNIQTLVRDYSGDNFSYQYYEGTNRLRSVDGGVTQHYAYDYNGNLISDSRRNITSIKYDNRNLPAEMIISSIFMAKSYKIEYKYDESGNRLRKKIYENEAISGEAPVGWKLIKDEVYVRDAGGKEIAVYQNSTLDYYNLWGNGLEGKTKKDERGNTKYYYYYKDHLGSVRAVMDGSFGTTVQAQDYEAWGDIFRSYTSEDISQNKFTSKERDAETGYDYFGARYYDSRVGNWLSPDPLSEKHIGWSPYNYVLRNPYILIDPDGKQLNISGDNNQKIFDKWDKDYLNFNANTGLVTVKDNISTEDFNKEDRAIYEFAKNHRTSEGKNIIANIYSENQPYHLNGEEKIFFLGGGFGKNYNDNNGNIIMEQYLYYPHIQRVASYGILSVNKFIRHEIFERIISPKYNFDYNKSHANSEDEVAQINYLWYQFYKVSSSSVIEEGIYDIRESEKIPYYRYDIEKGTFIFK